MSLKGNLFLLNLKMLKLSFTIKENIKYNQFYYGP